jgi:opacity protein-like surface antigen
MKKFVPMMLVAAVAAAPSAFAQGSDPAPAPSSESASVGYFEGGYKQTKFDVLDIDISSGSIQGRAGFNYGKYLSGELELGYGIRSDDVFGADIGVKTSTGLWGKVNLPLGDRFGLFARAGATYLEIDADGNEGFDNGYGLGVGATLSFTDNVYGRLDVSRSTIDDIDFNEIAISIGTRF